MSFQPQHRPILASALALSTALTVALALGGCGQKGPLYIPDTPAAAQRATLPQTVWGGARAAPATSPAAAGDAPALPAPAPQAPASVLPNLPDIQ